MAPLNSDAVREEVRRFLLDWFAAVNSHNRDWLSSHLGSEYVNWIVPEGAALTRLQYIDVAMAMETFEATFVDLRVEETADYITALYTIITLRGLPDPASIDNNTRNAMIDAAVYGIDPQERKKKHSGVYTTILRRGHAGNFQVVHHVFLGSTLEVEGDE